MTRWLFMIMATIAAAIVGASCVIDVDDDDQHWSDRWYYEPCSYDHECPGASECWLVTVEYFDGPASERICTAPCTFDFECPHHGACIDALEGPPLCFERCTGDYDCADGMACVAEIDGRSYEPACLPW